MAVDAMKIRQLLLSSAKNILEHEEQLTKLDAELGDGDHGMTMSKIAKAIIETANRWDESTDVKVGLEELTETIEDISGGSAAPLFASFVEGMADAADPAEDTDVFIRNILVGAYDGFFDMSGAEPGGKSMMDAIYPATEVIKAEVKVSRNVLENAATAARSGSDATADMLGKYGRARYHKEKSIGHIDPGSVTFALFYEGLVKGY